MLWFLPFLSQPDVFFDMDSKSYSTFMNGITDNTCTCYPGLLPEHGAAYKAYGCLFMLYGRTGGFKGSSVLYEGGASV